MAPLDTVYVRMYIPYVHMLTEKHSTTKTGFLPATDVVLDKAADNIL